jgi:hypothetical protein
MIEEESSWGTTGSASSLAFPFPLPRLPLVVVTFSTAVFVSVECAARCESNKWLDMGFKNSIDFLASLASALSFRLEAESDTTA